MLVILLYSYLLALTFSWLIISFANYCPKLAEVLYLEEAYARKVLTVIALMPVINMLLLVMLLNLVFKYLWKILYG
jgi:hypothetical protein